MIKLKEEKGVVLLTALLIMIILTLVGIGAIINSGVEMNISRNERLQKDALFAADAGAETVPRIVNCYINPEYLTSDIQDIVQDANFTSEVMDFSDSDGATDCIGNNPDVQMTLQGRQVDIDIDRLTGAEQVAGQPVYSPGADPDASAGALVCYYRADSLGKTDQGTEKTVEVIYRAFIPPL